MKKILVLITSLLIVMFQMSCGSEVSNNTAPSISVESTSEASDTSSISVESSSADSVEESVASKTEASSLKVDTEESRPGVQVQNNHQAGQITAGEWNDNDNFDYFRDILNDNEWYGMQAYWGFTNWERFEFEIVNHVNQPIIGALIELYDDQSVLYLGKTDNHGKAITYPFVYGEPYNNQLKAKITYNQSLYEIVDLNTQDDYFKVTIDEKATKVSDIDIMLVIDTTGSMSDELMYLKNEFADVIRRVDNDNQNQLSFRLSSNFYRDRGDQYVTKSFPFTDDLDEVIRQLQDQDADGGGDYEEAVVEALYDAVFDHNWSQDAQTKLLFLVLDAPPHHTDQNIDGIHNVVKEANALGIKIIPIASSGIDKNTEFLLRFLSTATGGTYTFLTDHSGIGNSHITPTIGHYQVEQLNQMMIRLINKYVE